MEYLDFGPERGEPAREYLRRRVVRRHFTSDYQWHAVQQVLEEADPAAKLDDLQQDMCRTRLRAYRSQP